jgi:hypothetical protein
MDTFSVADTGNVMTEDPNFAVVSLRQGKNLTKRCTVSLEIFNKQDLNKIKPIDSDKEDWKSLIDSQQEDEEELEKEEFDEEFVRIRRRRL